MIYVLIRKGKIWLQYMGMNANTYWMADDASFMVKLTLYFSKQNTPS